MPLKNVIAIQHIAPASTKTWDVMVRLLPRVSLFSLVVVRQSVPYKKTSVGTEVVVVTSVEQVERHRARDTAGHRKRQCKPHHAQV